ncbi:MAG TPA: hypothetical protein PLH82_02105 [Candidatus Paceibacterota bacterium]|nr:hypothetical protein [Candidatus Paceibacterota bacterium]
MRKIIKNVNRIENIVQITIADERWYQIDNEFFPSVTWISGFYPKGIAFYKWLAERSWNEAEAIKSAAGDKGSKIHSAIVNLIDGLEVKMDSQFENPTTGLMEELSLEEYEAILSFKSFCDELKPKFIDREFVVVSDKYQYAGTGDILCEINNKIHLIDIKSGQSIWPEYELQISAYAKALQRSIDKMSILQVGYRLNKKKWKLTEIDDKFDLFLSARNIWKNECDKISPLRKDLPLAIKL